MRPETQVLLCCARAGMQQEDEARFRSLLAQPLNWDILYTSARQQGIAPLVYWHLSRLDSQEVPLHVLDEFRREFEENAARNFYLTSELIKISSLLHAQGIAVAAYKGPVLAILAYRNLLLRTFCDLDILLSRRDLPAVHALLLEQGYEQQFHSDLESNEYAHSFVRHEADGGSVVIEAHWSITPPHYALPEEPTGALDRLVPFYINGSQIWTLTPHDQLLALCWHNYKHRWARLEWITCIAEILRNSNNGFDANLKMDWAQLLAQARKLGSKRLLFTGLGLAHSILGVSLPEFVLNEMQSDRKLQELLRYLQSTLFHKIDDIQSTAELDSVRFFHLNSRERLRDKLKYCWRLALTPGQIDWRPLHLMSGNQRKA